VRGGDQITLGTNVAWARNGAYGPYLHFTKGFTGRAVLTNTFTPSATDWSAEVLIRVTTAAVASDFEYIFATAAVAGDGMLLTNATPVIGWNIDTSTADVSVGSLPTLNIWLHVVYTVASTTGTIYQNGVSVASGALTGAFTNPMGWMGSDGTNNGSQFDGDIAWLRVWDRALTAREVVGLYADPWEMVISGSEQVAAFAGLGGWLRIAPSAPPRAVLAVAPPVVAPFRPYLGATTSNIVSGAATIIANSALVETAAQILSPATEQANSLIAAPAQVVEPSTNAATSQSNSLLVETAAQIRAVASEVSNSALVETSAVILAPATEQANSLLVENAQLVDPSAPTISNSLLVAPSQLVEPVTSPAPEQGNSAVVQTVGTVVDPSVPLVSNSILIASGQIAGGTIVNGAATTQSNSALVQSAAQLLAQVQSQSASSLVQQQAQIVARGVAVLAASVLVGNGGLFGQIIAGDALGADTALHTATPFNTAIHTATGADIALMSDAGGDVTMGTATATDSAVMSAVAADSAP
jgi:hypothetical protein